jgi:hypothetical protein
MIRFALFALAFAATCAGCGTTAIQYAPQYDGPRRPIDHVAQLDAEQADIYTRKINGNDPKNVKLFQGGPIVYELLPGRYVVSVFYMHNEARVSSSSMHDVDVKFDALPGHQYTWRVKTVQLGPNEFGMYPEIIDKADDVLIDKYSTGSPAER